MRDGELAETLMAITPGPLVLLDAGGRIVRSNAAFQRLAGGAALEGKPFVGLIAPADRPQTTRMIQDVAPSSAELRLGGSPDAPLVMFTAARSGDGVLLAGADLTPQRRLEARVLQARKGESLARLTRGMAHDFNNALAVVMSYAELILMDLEPDDPRRTDVQTIREAAVRAGELTRQILVFSRAQSAPPRPVDLNALVLGLDMLLRRLIGEDIELVTLLGENLGFADGDPGQIEAGIVHAVVTALDTLGAGGSITIETGLGADDQLCLTVTHGGGEPFELRLPRSRGIDAPPPSAAMRGTETILVADDNEMVRRGISAMLASRGFTVLTAANGEEALRLVRTQATVDLVLADVVMPRMTALDLDTALRETRPGIKIVFMSGYAEDAVSQGIVKPAGFIQKPFTAEALAGKVRQVLSA